MSLGKDKIRSLKSTSELNDFHPTGPQSQRSTFRLDVLSRSIWVVDNISVGRVVGAALAVVSTAILETVIGEVQITIASRPCCHELATRSHFGIKSIVTVELGIYGSGAISVVLIRDV